MNDPVKHCKLYKELGCSHVDGMLCDFPKCSMLKEYEESELKPNWKDAPEYVSWLAQDRDGQWNWYEVEPEPDLEMGFWLSMGAEYEEATVFCSNRFPSKTWLSSLEKRP